MAKSMKVLYHDNCFDGVSSAAVFSRFYKECIDGKAAIEYEGLTHKAGQQISDDLFGSDENAIVDFKYSSDNRLTWWFDHHESAFLSPKDELHFRSDSSGHKFHDPTFKSCTKYIAHIAKVVFGFPLADLEELIYWADIIDGAQFPDAKTAVELNEPALKLMLVIEAAHNRQLTHKIIRELQQKPLMEVLQDSEVRATFDKLYEHHFESIETMRQAATCVNGVIEFDVSAYDLDGYNKFIPYYLFPESMYSVGVSKSPLQTKVSVGSNPWNNRERRCNLAKLCEQYGGGGHSVVAAISFRPDGLTEARQAASEIALKLRSELQQ
jgi:hypothetical protein